MFVCKYLERDQQHDEFDEGIGAVDLVFARITANSWCNAWHHIGLFEEITKVSTCVGGNLPKTENLMVVHKR